MTLWSALLDVLDAIWWSPHRRFNVSVLCAVGFAFFAYLAIGESSRPYIMTAIVAAGVVAGIVWEGWGLFDWFGHWRLYIGLLSGGVLGWLFYSPYRGSDTRSTVAAIVACAVACIAIVAGLVWDSRGRA